MENFTIINRFTHTIIFEGTFNSMKECVEQAVKEGVNLHGAYLYDTDLSNANLRSADLTDTYLYRTNLRGADLCGANLDGAYLSLTIF